MIPARDPRELRAPGGPWQPPPRLSEHSERTRAEVPGAPLPRISLELSRWCNLRCVYCYSSAREVPHLGLSDADVRQVIREAFELGARTISIVGGGEPLLRRSVTTDGESCIDYANSLGCYCCLYTNGTLVDDRVARWLLQRDVTVIAKLNSLSDPVQDWLAGVRGTSVRIRRGIDALLRAGFARSTLPRFGLQTIICRQNYEEIPTLWRWMRRQGIVPEVEIPTMHGRAAAYRHEIYFADAEAPDKYRVLFEELLAIDRAEFGYDWVPHPPFVAGSCRLYYSNCYVNDRGGVQPCAGVERELGVLRVGARAGAGVALEHIVRSPELTQLRCIHEHLKGACRECDLVRNCYGCRAAAWLRSGDMFAEDPVCWRRKPRTPGTEPRLSASRDS